MKREKPAILKIQCTYDYDKFKLIGINRNVDKKHVMSIAEAIKFRNLLHLFPLIINKNWEVMDGQHRLGAVKYIEAAIALQLPLYYILDPNIEMDDMRLLNSNKINWKNQDYINYYAGKRMEPFVKLVEFQKLNPQINLSACILLLSSRKRNLPELKNGILLVDRLPHANKVINYVYSLKDKMDSQIQLWKVGIFLDAFSDIVLTKKYDHRIMLKSQRGNSEAWSRQASKRNYLYELNNTYNHNLTEREQVNFLKLCKY